MRKETKPFELVVHMDELGTRATATERTRTFEDDGTIDHAATVTKSVTLAKLGDDFPWKTYVDAALQSALVTIEALEATIAAKVVEKAEIVASKDTVIAAKDAEVAAGSEVAAAAKALAAKIAEVAEVEKDDPEREKKEAEAAQLAAQVADKDAALAFIKLPEKEQRDQKIRDEIARLQAQLLLQEGT